MKNIILKFILSTTALCSTVVQASDLINEETQNTPKKKPHYEEKIVNGKVCKVLIPARILELREKKRLAKEQADKVREETRTIAVEKNQSSSKKSSISNQMNLVNAQYNQEPPVKHKSVKTVNNTNTIQINKTVSAAPGKATSQEESFKRYRELTEILHKDGILDSKGYDIYNKLAHSHQHMFDKEGSLGLSETLQNKANFSPDSSKAESVDADLEEAIRLSLLENAPMQKEEDEYQKAIELSRQEAAIETKRMARLKEIEERDHQYALQVQQELEKEEQVRLVKARETEERNRVDLERKRIADKKADTRQQAQTKTEAEPVKKNVTGAGSTWQDNPQSQEYLKKFIAWKNTFLKIAQTMHDEIEWLANSLDDNDPLLSINATQNDLAKAAARVRNYLEEDAIKFFTGDIAGTIAKNAAYKLDTLLQGLAKTARRVDENYRSYAVNHNKPGLQALLNELNDEIENLNQTFSNKDEIGREVFERIPNIALRQPAAIAQEAKKASQPLPSLVIEARSYIADRISNIKHDFMNESVMEYASVARNSKDVSEQIDIVMKNFNPKIDNNFVLKNTDSLMSWITQIHKAYDLDDASLKHIKSSLDISWDREKNNYKNVQVYGKAQYEYMMEVSNTLHNLYGLYHSRNNESFENIVNIYLNGLVEQDGRCHSGMIGRMFIVNYMIFNFLIDEYKK